MLKHSRRSFLLALPALPFAAKAFVRPEPAVVAEFQAVYPPALPIGGTFRLINNGIASDPIAYNATDAEIQEAMQGINRRGGRIPLSRWNKETSPFKQPVSDYHITIDTKVTNKYLPCERLELDFTIDGHCSSCQNDYRVKGSREPDYQVVEWSCPHCGKPMLEDLKDLWK